MILKSCLLCGNFISIYITNRTLHGRLGIRTLSSRAALTRERNFQHLKIIPIPARPCNILYLYRLQNVNNLPKDYIRMCLTCRSFAGLFNFIGLVERQGYNHLFDLINISDHSTLINSNLLQRKSLIFCCVSKDFDFIFNKLEISISEAVTTQYWIGLWNAE